MTPNDLLKQKTYLKINPSSLLFFSLWVPPGYTIYYWAEEGINI